MRGLKETWSVRMRRLFPLLLLLQLCGQAGLGQGQPLITHVQEVKALTNAQATQKLPVKIEATVTYARPSEKNLFVMEDGAGIYVRFARDMGLMPGDRVAVTGYTEPS